MKTRPIATTGAASGTPNPARGYADAMEFLVAVAHVVAFFVGVFIVGTTVMSAIKTFVLPRAANVRISRFVFVVVRLSLERVAPPSRDYADRDRVFAMQAPYSLIGLPIVWLLLIVAGFTLMYAGLGAPPQDAFVISGSSLFTLGFDRPPRLAAIILTFLEAAIGLGLVALLISYLPTIYAAFSRREIPVAMLEANAGTPPTASALLRRHHRIGGLERLDELWVTWRQWFADIEESHTSIAALIFFRSPDPDRHWITAAGCILDSAAVYASCLDVPKSADCQLCIRGGYVALQRIADFFSYPYNPDPRPDDPISIERSEFDDLWKELEDAGLPMRTDQEQAWRDYAGWRVNYDPVLLFLSGITAAPIAPWSSDRGLRYKPPPVLVTLGLRKLPRRPAA
jgi:hypothetical protein